MFKSLLLASVIAFTSFAPTFASAAIPMECRQRANNPTCKALIQRDRKSHAIKGTPNKTVSQSARPAQRSVSSVRHSGRRR